MRPRWTSLLALLPALAVVVLLFVVPVASLARASVEGGLAHYVRLLEDPYYLSAFVVTFGTALLVSVLAVVLSYPLAVAYWQASPHRRMVLGLLLLSPFYASVTVKVFGWMVLLPAAVRDSYWAIVIIDVHRALPVAVLLLAAAMARIEPEVVEAARICGAGPLRVFRSVVAPLSLPGAIGAGVLVFGLTATSFVVPLLVGGTAGRRFLPVLMYQQFTVAQNWGFAAAMAIVLLLTMIVAVMTASRMAGASAVGGLAREDHSG